MGSTRIAVRMDDRVLEEIDEFLATYGTFDSRSELIRAAVLDYIDRVRSGTTEGVPLKPHVRAFMENLVYHGLASDVSDAIGEVLEWAYRKRYLMEYLAEAVEINREMRHVFSEYAETLESMGGNTPLVSPRRKVGGDKRGRRL